MTKSIFTNKHKDCKTIFHLHIFAAAMLAMLLMMPSGTEAQELIESPNDPTFVTEYRNNSQFGVSAKNRLVVSLGNKFVKDEYGKFYQLSIIIQNLSPNTYTFDPDSIRAYALNNGNMLVKMKEYSSDRFREKIRSKRGWTSFFTGLDVGLNAGQASNDDSHGSSMECKGCSYLQPVTTHNIGEATKTNLEATNELIELGKKMESDRKIRIEGYLTRNTINPGEGIYGYVNVKRVKGKVMSVIIPVNGTKYVFKWDISQVKE